jgi:hypothetical protein
MKRPNLAYRVCIPALLCSFAQTAHAQENDPWWKSWNVFGSNTAKVEHIENDGNEAASPYPNDGAQAYDEFDVNFSRNYSPFRKVSGQVFGVVNASDYRNNDEGFVPERLNLLYENGEAATPYRIEAGDYFANISYRTMQRSLKGTQIEFQPFSESQSIQHSVLFFSGANQASWRNVDISDNISNGASWLMEHPEWGRLSVNTVYTQLDGDRNGTTGGLDQEQWLGSVAIDTPLTVGSQLLNLEAEVANFSGDHGNTVATQDRSDNAYFVELTGQNTELRQLDYRVRFEQYGTDYRPDGAIITPDRRSEELHVGWRFDNSIKAQGRAQYFHDSFDSTNQQDTVTHGIKFTGGLLGSAAPDVSGAFDFYSQQIEDQLKTRDLDSLTADLTLNKPINADWNSEIRGFFQTTDDNTGSGQDNIIRQVRVRMHRSVAWDDISGTISPGILVRDIDNGSNDRFELEPTLDVSLYKDQHSLTANYGYLAQNDLIVGNPDVGTHTAGLNYNYTKGIHELGVEAYYYDRYVQALEDTNTTRVGVYWTLHFDKPANETDFGFTQTAANTTYDATDSFQLESPELGLTDISLLGSFVPGRNFDRQIDKLTALNFSDANKIGPHYVYETSLLNYITQRQRLVLVEKNNQLSKAGVIIEIENNGRPESAAQLFERTLDTLISYYGSPSRQYEEGTLSGDIRGKVNAGKLIRTYEWKTKTGIIRYGIPKSVSGDVRLEIQHAKDFGSLRNTRWGFTLP